MLKFKGNSLTWGEIQSVIISNEDANEVSVVTADGSFVVGEYQFASEAATIKGLIERGKESNAIGGIGTTVIIDDL